MIVPELSEQTAALAVEKVNTIREQISALEAEELALMLGLWIDGRELEEWSVGACQSGTDIIDSHQCGDPKFSLNGPPAKPKLKYEKNAARLWQSATQHYGRPPDRIVVSTIYEVWAEYDRPGRPPFRLTPDLEVLHFADLLNPKMNALRMSAERVQAAYKALTSGGTPEPNLDRPKGGIPP